MIDSIRGKSCPMKIFAEKVQYNMAGNKQRREGEYELMKLKRPQYQIPDELKPQ